MMTWWLQLPVDVIFIGCKRGRASGAFWRSSMKRPLLRVLAAARARRWFFSVKPAIYLQRWKRCFNWWSLLVFGWSLPRFNLLIQKKGTESRISPRTFKKISAMMDNGIDFLHEQLLQLLDLSHVGVTSISCAATMLRCALADGLLRMRTWLGWPSHAFPKHHSFWMEWRQTGPDRYSLCLENRKFQVV